MTTEAHNDSTLKNETYYVVRNIEDQYSIWPSYKPIPKGWEAIGEPKVKPDCLTYIEKNWTDMRPKSLRNQMEEMLNGKEKNEFTLDIHE